jgi:hypothetical protein
LQTKASPGRIVSADVEGDHIGEAGGGGDDGGAGDAGRRTRQAGAHRCGAHRRRRHQPAIRMQRIGLHGNARRDEGKPRGGVVDDHGAAGLARIVGRRVREIEEGFRAGAGEFEELDAVLVAADAQQPQRLACARA